MIQTYRTKIFQLSILVLIGLGGCTFKNSYGGKFITPSFKTYSRPIVVEINPANARELPFQFGTVSLRAVEVIEQRKAVGADSTEIAIVIELKNPSPTNSGKTLPTEPIVKSLALKTPKSTCQFSGPYTSGDVWSSNPAHSLQPGKTGSFRATATCNGVELFQPEAELSFLGSKLNLKELK